MGDTIREKQNKLTEDAICNSFIGLLNDKPLEKITVADVCRVAKINRGTFYLHYRDINDLIDYINSWYIEAISPFCFQDIELKPNRETAEARYKKIIEILLSWPEYSIVILGHEKGQSVIDRVIELGIETCLETCKFHFPEKDYTESLYMFTAELYAIWAIFRKWCRDGLNEKPEQIIKYLLRLNSIFWSEENCEEQ